MKKIILMLFISVAAIGAAQTKGVQNKKHGFYKVTKVTPEKTLASDETKVVFNFVGPTNTPARNHIKIVCNEDSAFPVIDVTGTYSAVIDPGKYKMRFEVPFWHVVATDSIFCKKQTTTHISVKFEAKDMK